MSAGEPVLLFQVGPRLYAARAGGVARVAAPGEVGGALVEESCLGRPLHAARALAAPGGGALAVDQVLGVRRLEASEVRPLPAVAAGMLGSAAVAGLVLLDGAAAPLVDLPTLIRERHGAAATRLHDA